MNNPWLIEDKIFCGLLITHRCQWFVIDVIDYSLITIDYPSITNFPPASASNIEKYPFLLKWCLPVDEVMTQARLTRQEDS